jgi:BRCA1-associated protein
MLPFIVGNDSIYQSTTNPKISGIVEFFIRTIPFENIVKNCGISLDISFLNDLENLFDPIQQNLDPTSLVKNDNENSCMVCLLLIPSYMIPNEMLKYFNSYLDQILSIRILRHYYDKEKYLCLIQLTSHEYAKRFILDYHKQMLSSLDNTYCLLYLVKNIKYCSLDQWRYDDSFIESFTRSSRSNSIDMPLPFRSPDAVGDSDLYGNIISETNLQSLYESISSPYSRSVSPVRTPHDTMKTSEDDGMMDDEITCPVCLDRIISERPCTFTMGCNHTFHIGCVLRLEGPQCPVCRYINISNIYN